MGYPKITGILRAASFEKNGEPSIITLLTVSYNGQNIEIAAYREAYDQLMGVVETGEIIEPKSAISNTRQEISTPAKIVKPTQPFVPREHKLLDDGVSLKSI